MKRVVVICFAHFDRKSNRMDTWGDVVLVDVYNPDELAECDLVENAKQKVRDMGLGVRDFQVTFTDVTDKIIKEFPIENIDLLHRMAGCDEPFDLYEPKVWRDKIGDSKWHCVMNSIGGVLAEGIDETMEGAIKKCYDGFVEMRVSRQSSVFSSQSAVHKSKRID